MWARNSATCVGARVRQLANALQLLARTGNSDPGGRSVDATSIPPLLSILPLGQCASCVDSVGSRDFAAMPLVQRLQEGTCISEQLHRARIEGRLSVRLTYPILMRQRRA
eukprot:3655175-Pleurochrysis_carterae.AAC.1